MNFSRLVKVDTGGAAGLGRFTSSSSRLRAGVAILLTIYFGIIDSSIAGADFLPPKPDYLGEIRRDKDGRLTVLPTDTATEAKPFHKTKSWTSFDDKPLEQQISIVVREAIPAGVIGLTRKLEPVTVGIPFSEKSDYKFASGFSLQGGRPAQFRVLARWPNQNIKWLLADFQTDLVAGESTEVVVLPEEPHTNLSPLAMDKGDAIEVITGNARFTIRKKNFNLFDTVRINGEKLVLSGNQGKLAMRTPTGEEFSSLNDKLSDTTIEENGPLRAVIKADGAFRNSAGKRLADYTLRLHFHKGKNYVKGHLVLRNASIKSPSALYFHTLEASVKLSTDGPLTAVLSRKSDALSFPLERNQQAQLFQGYSEDKNNYVNKECYSWEPPIPGVCNESAFRFAPDHGVSGLEITAGDQRPQVLGNPQEWTQGWAQLSDKHGHGVTLGKRWMSAYWPAGFELRGDGTATIELFSKRNPKHTLKLPFSRHDGRELIWEFHSKSSDPTATIYALQYPLVARAEFQNYQRSGVLYGQKEFVSPEEQSGFFSAIGQPMLFQKIDNPDFKTVYRYWPWPMGGGGNQTDVALSDWLDYLRTGHGGFYLQAQHRSMFDAITAISYADDYEQNTQPQPVTQDSQPKQRSMIGNGIDAEHAHILSMPIAYFLTGDEGIKDALLEYGRQLDGWQRRGFFQIPETQYFRAWSRIYRNLAILYEFTCNLGECNKKYREYVERATEDLLDSRDAPHLGLKSPRGRNMERGYIYWDSELTTPATGRLVHSFFHTQIHFEAVWQVLRILNHYESPYRRSHEVEDYLLGLSRFFFDEFYDEFGSGVTQAGFQYDYPLDKPYARPIKLMPQDVSRAALFIYVQTGNTSYLEKGYGQIWRTMKDANHRNPSEFQDQALMHAWLHKPIHWLPLDVSVERTGQTYHLSWREPAPGSKYEIKFSDKPIIDWLGFDRVTRSYKHDPTSFSSYFAANRLASNPMVVEFDAIRKFTVRGLSCKDRCHFALRYLH
jgi:hypothetical protein